ncbi:MAG: aminopeptidase [Cyclobacteriaceae bacterium]
MNTTKKVLLLIIIVVAGITAFKWDIVSYGWMQGKGQLKILYQAKPLESFLNDVNYPDSLKAKIRLVQSVKSFGESIGMNPSENYSTIYDQGNQPILWNVTACAPFSFEQVTWSFPLLGAVGYKGYFDFEKAKSEEAKWKAMSYDTRIRTVSAWSTLGWFKDPIMSNMLYRSDGYLAETILHELLHGTVFFKDSLVFNENLASFIGEQAAIQFLNKQYGDSSAQLLSYLQAEKDATKFQQHILSGKEKLDSLYQTFNQSGDTVSMLEQKTQTIFHIISTLDTVSFYDKRYLHIFDEQKPNNAYFMAYQRYHSQKDLLDSLYDLQGRNIKSFIEYCKNSEGSNVSD